MLFTIKHRYKKLNERTIVVMKKSCETPTIWETSLYGSPLNNVLTYLITAKALYFVASGGQSGWLDGWAARNAGWFSSSRSIRKMMGNGLKSTWNLGRNDQIKLHIQKFDFNIIILVEHNHVLPSRIEHLWNEAAICNGYFITNAVFASTRRQQLFNRWAENTY